MREIKFRAWDFTENKMMDTLELSYGVQYNKNKIEIISQKDCFTFMQFTGLFDRHGVEIYEGDFILLGTSNGKPIYGEVVFELDILRVPCFCIKEDEDTLHTFFDKDDDERVWFEVKGNKYENRKSTND